jgi:hypothetical protein
MKSVYAHAVTVRALEELARIEKTAYIVPSQDVSPRVKLARIRLLRKEADATFQQFKKDVRAKHEHSKKP